MSVLSRDSTTVAADASQPKLVCFYLSSSIMFVSLGVIKAFLVELSLDIARSAMELTFIISSN